MTEREQFEAWMRDTHGPGVNLVRSDDGYISTVPHRIVRMTYASVEMLWEAWQAARAQSSTPNPVEVGTTVQAKRVPMTEAQINDAYGAASVQHDHIPHDDVARIARAVERHHGIVGEKGKP